MKAGVLNPRPGRAPGSHPDASVGALLNPPHAHASEWAKVKEKKHLLEK